MFIRNERGEDEKWEFSEWEKKICEKYIVLENIFLNHTVPLPRLSWKIKSKNLVFRGSGCRLSLVRPDHGWFPGIEDIEKELEMNLAEIQSIQREKKANRSAVV